MRFAIFSIPKAYPPWLKKREKLKRLQQRPRGFLIFRKGKIEKLTSLCFKIQRSEEQKTRGELESCLLNSSIDRLIRLLTAAIQVGEEKENAWVCRDRPLAALELTLAQVCLQAKLVPYDKGKDRL